MAKKSNPEPLKTWRIYGAIAGTKYFGEVKAATEEQAKEVAQEELDLGCSICHACSGEVEDPEVQELIAEEAS